MSESSSFDQNSVPVRKKSGCCLILGVAAAALIAIGCIQAVIRLSMNTSELSVKNVGNEGVALVQIGLPGAQYGMSGLQPNETRTFKVSFDRPGPIIMVVTSLDAKKHTWRGGRIANFGDKAVLTVDKSGVLSYTSVKM